MSEDLKPKEPIVLDSEGHILHDPTHSAGAQSGPKIRVVNFNSIGLIPKILLGTGFIALLVLGLTVAGVALGVLLVTFLARTIFKPRR